MSISRKRLDKLRKMTDKDIDFSDIPELDDQWFKEAKIVMPAPKKAISLRVDQEVLTWFKAQGKGYQSRMNAVLKAYVEAQKVQSG